MDWLQVVLTALELAVISPQGLRSRTSASRRTLTAGMGSPFIPAALGDIARRCGWSLRERECYRDAIMPIIRAIASFVGI